MYTLAVNKGATLKREIKKLVFYYGRKQSSALPETRKNGMYINESIRKKCERKMAVKDGKNIECYKCKIALLGKRNWATSILPINQIMIQLKFFTSRKIIELRRGKYFVCVSSGVGNFCHIIN